MSALFSSVMWKVFKKLAGNKADLHCVPSKLMAPVMGKYRNLRDRCGFENQENPIVKLPLGVTGVNAQLIVDAIMTEGTALSKKRYAS